MDRSSRVVAVLAVAFSLALAGCTEPAPSTAPTTPSAQTTPAAQTPLRVPDAQRIGVVGTDSDGAITASETTQYITWVIQDADRVWTNWMMGRGFKEPYVQYFIIQAGAPVTVTNDKCAMKDPRNNLQPTKTVDSEFPNAFYCGAEPNGVDLGVILLPVGTLARAWDGEILGSPVSDPTKVGDFAAATVVAHEFGHHVQDEMGTATNTPRPVAENKELLADCFAGVWTTVLYQQGGLEEGDIDEALNALAAIADKAPGGEDPHGTAEQRTSAFKLGIYGTSADPRGGIPGNCLSAYWPAYTGAR